MNPTLDPTIAESKPGMCANSKSEVLSGWVNCANSLRDCEDQCQAFPKCFGLSVAALTNPIVQYVNCEIYCILHSEPFDLMLEPLPHKGTHYEVYNNSDGVL